MELILTKHTKKRMIERKITIQEIKETVGFPDYTIKKEGKIEAHKRINTKALRIVYVIKGKFIKVITVIEK